MEHCKHFECTKIQKKYQKWSVFIEAETAFPDRSTFIGQKFVENAKIVSF